MKERRNKITMEKQRQSNYELLRILSIIVILLYHFMLYNGVISLPYNQFTVHGLILCSGALAPNYAFMAVSSYFLLESKDTNVLPRFKKNLIQVLVLFIIKMTIVCGILGYSSDVKFYNDFFIKGSWWFIYIYLVILLIYPLLNKIVFHLNINRLGLVCVLFGVWFVINGVTNQVNYLNDFICFVFTYFVVGYLKRKDYKVFGGIKDNKKGLLLLFAVCYLITFTVCYLAKTSEYSVLRDYENQIIQHFIGKYSFLQFLMGLAVFLLFKNTNIPYNKWINAIAKNVLYVFLLHETVLAIFWWFGKLRTVDNQLPFANNIEFIGSCVLFVGSSFWFGVVVRKVYQYIFKEKQGGTKTKY